MGTILSEDLKSDPEVAKNGAVPTEHEDDGDTAVEAEEEILSSYFSESEVFAYAFMMKRYFPPGGDGALSTDDEEIDTFESYVNEDTGNFRFKSGDKKAKIADVRKQQQIPVEGNTEGTYNSMFGMPAKDFEKQVSGLLTKPLIMTEQFAEQMKNVLDTGCSQTMSPRDTSFIFINPRSSVDPKTVVTAGKHHLDVQGVGDFKLELPGGRHRIIHDSLYVPKLMETLVSVGQMVDHDDDKVIFTKNRAILFDAETKEFVELGQRWNNLYYFIPDQYVRADGLPFRSDSMAGQRGSAHGNEAVTITAIVDESEHTRSVTKNTKEPQSYAYCFGAGVQRRNRGLRPGFHHARYERSYGSLTKREKIGVRSPELETPWALSSKHFTQTNEGIRKSQHSTLSNVSGRGGRNANHTHVVGSRLSDTKAVTETNYVLRNIDLDLFHRRMGHVSKRTLLSTFRVAKAFAGGERVNSIKKSVTFKESSGPIAPPSSEGGGLAQTAGMAGAKKRCGTSQEVVSEEHLWEDMSNPTDSGAGHTGKGNSRTQIPISTAFAGQTNRPITSCIACDVGKQTAKHIGSSDSKFTHVNEQWNFDLHGKIPTESYHRKKYLLLLVDAFTKWTYGVVIRKKSEAWKHIRDILNQSAALHEKPILNVQSDRGTEWRNENFESWCKKQKVPINCNWVPAYTHEYSGLHERIIRTITEMGRCMLAESHLPLKFWEFAYLYAVYIKNRLMHTKHGRTPYEKWFKRLPDLSRIRVFGCLVMMLIPPELRKNKLTVRSTPGIFLGLKGTKTVLVYNLVTEGCSYIAENCYTNERLKKFFFHFLFHCA